MNRDMLEKLINNKDFDRKLIPADARSEYVYPDSFNPDRWMESTHGIHF